MKRSFIILIVIMIVGVASAQRVNYSKMQTGYILIENDGDRTIDGLTVIQWVATESVKNLEKDSKELSEELRKKQPDQEKVNKLKKDIQQWEETAKKHRIGREEPLGCYIEYIIDDQGKLKIVGKTKDGIVLFEFGKGHNQELVLYTEDDDKDFNIGIFDHGGGGIVGVVQQWMYNSTIYIGNVKHDQYIEYIALDTGDDQQILNDQNSDAVTLLRKKLLSIFPKDSDGDRWMLCK